MCVGVYLEKIVKHYEGKWVLLSTRIGVIGRTHLKPVRFISVFVLLSHECLCTTDPWTSEEKSNRKRLQRLLRPTKRLL